PVDVVDLTSGIISVSTGYRHTCAVTTSGGVKCWGDNDFGQLGDGTYSDSYVPVDVVDLTSGIISVSTGYWHTCAVTTSGGVKCWGSNYYGELGDGTTTYSNIPVDVVGLTSGVAFASSGYRHTCAVTTSGGVKCWGWNENGQLGVGTTRRRYTPVDVVGLTSGIASISSGGRHICAVTTSGGVKCWGSNKNGQLGDGTTTNSYTPVDVVGLTSGVASVSSGNLHTCAVTNSGGVKCWGSNYYSQLGDGSDISRYMPVDVVELTSGVDSVSSGNRHTCAVTTSGGVKCWGNNDYGQLGDGTTTDSYIPVDVVGLTSGIASVSSGVDHTCAVTNSGGVKCWGSNFIGKLGDGTSTDSYMPVDVVELTSGVDSVSSGNRHTCAVTTSGGVKCWGNNDYGQLGDGTTTDSYIPVDVVGLTSGIASVSSGVDHTCAVTNSGGVKCWGSNFIGKLGDGTSTDSYMPVDVVGLTSGVASISSVGNHTCAVTTSGGVKCWGDDYYGQLGDGTTTDSYTPVDVEGLTSGIASISSGGGHTCAVTTSGGVKCWGDNLSGQLGINPGWVPVNVIGF
ncbi:MAG TPA: RCC1 repeat-containing protein, partial [bacterium]|nr:RCC1 repeat-containing protein [bacterium]